MSAAQKYASQAVEDLQESTGLADNFDGKITAVKFTSESPSDKYTTDGNPIFSVWTIVINGDTPVAERTVSQSYSLGATAGNNFDIGSDGYGLIPKTDDSTLRKDSKHGTLLASFAAEGLPKAILQAGDFSKLIGLEGHFKRVADKERTFTSERQGAKKKFPPSTLVCTRIIALPGVGVVASANTAPAAGGSDIDTRAGQYLAAVVKAKGGKLQRSQILLLVAKAAGDAGDSDKQAVAKRATEEAFLVGISEAGGVVDAAGDVVAINYNPAVKPQMVTIG